MIEDREKIRRIIKTINCIEGLYEVSAKWKGVKANTLTLLYALDDEEVHTQKSISEGWLIPRTTLNTIIKECVSDGYIMLKPIKGCRRDLRIVLTNEGKEFTKKLLMDVYIAENMALSKTLESCNEDFIESLKVFSENLKKMFENIE